MKKCILFLLAITVLLCGCEKNEAPPEITAENKIEKVFSDDNVTAFDLDADGKVRYLTFVETDEFEEFSFPDGGTFKEPIYRLNLFAEDKDEPYILDEENGPANMCADGDTIYYTSYVRDDGGENIALFRYSLTDNAKERLYTYRNITLVKKILLVGDKIFTLALAPSKYGIGEAVEINDGYYNDGEVLSCFDFVTNTESVIWETGAVELGAWGNKLVIYAHDNDGFFFVSCDASTMEYSDKIPADLGMIYAFAMCNENRYIYCSIGNNFSGSCATMGSLVEKGKADIELGEAGLAGNVKCSNGHIFFIDSAPQSETFGRLICADISAALHTNLSEFLTMAYSIIPELAPSSVGFSLIGEQLEGEELALDILSQSSDHDLFLFTSQDDFSQNVKSKGSFYPLNDIDGVAEYLNDCFPFIREAMTDENGNVWALPVSLRVDALCYNNEAFDLSENTTPDEFMAALSKAQSDKMTYFVSPILYSNLLLKNYLSHNTSFDTSSFRELAEWLKEKLFENEASLSSEDDYFAALSAGRPEDVDLEFICYPSDYARYSKISSKALARIPNFSDKNETVCTFVCVNPFSEHLDEAKKYLSTLAGSLRADKENLCVSELSVYETSELYSELKLITDNGSIVFNCPDEVYADAFYEYIDGKRTLEEFITDADRKLAAYLNE